MTVRHDERAEQAVVARLEQLSAEFAATPDDEFRAATRRRLVAMAAVRTPSSAPGRRAPADRRAGLRRPTTAVDPRWRTRLTAGLTGAALTVTALGGLLAAAQGARPGDLLYDVKRGGEQTELALAGDAERGLTLLGFASTRLAELGELVGVSPSAAAVVPPGPAGGEAGLAAGPDVELVVDTLRTMDRQTTEGTAELTARAVQGEDEQALATLVGWTGDQRAGIELLAPAAPTGAEDALDASRDLVDAVAARGTGLLEALACPGGPATAGSDELGPLPAPCTPPPAGGVGTPTSSPGTSAPGSASAGGSPPAPAGSAGATPGAPAAPAGTGSAVPPPGTQSGTAPGRAPASAPATAAPGSTSARPVPPPLPDPGTPAPAPTSAPAPSTSAGAVIELPPIVPGLRVCVPPLITVNCRPSGG